MGRRKQVYKITYPNGKIDVGLDLTEPGEFTARGRAGVTSAGKKSLPENPTHEEQAAGPSDLPVYSSEPRRGVTATPMPNPTASVLNRPRRPTLIRRKLIEQCESSEYPVNSSTKHGALDGGTA
jgi:hypothetical protein